MKKISIIFLLVCLSFLFLTACEENNDLQKVRLNEVTHSIFYAPQYVAIEKGFFKEEGLDIELTTGWGADKSMTTLISGNADIGFMGPEASIYVFNEGKEDYVVNFAQLTQRAGNFLVSREKIENFKWDDVVGKTLIGGRKGGVPQMTLEYILKKKNINPYKDVNIINNIDFANTGGAFIGGTGDFTVEFEPVATKIENEGKGYVVESLGLSSGKIPYTTYMAKKSYLLENKEVVQKFTNALYKAQQWVKNNNSEEIAKAIQPQFKDMQLEDMIKIIDRYKNQETWNESPVFSEEGLGLLQDVLDEAGELEKFVDYKDIVTTDFAKESMK